MSSGPFYLKFLDRSISYMRGVCLVLILPCLTEIPVRNANSVDPDQTPHSAASDLGLQCLSFHFYGTPDINRLRSACAFAQTNQNLHWASFCQPNMQCFFILTTKDSDRTASRRSLIWAVVGRKSVSSSSRKHTYIILTPLNPTFI